MYDRGGYSWRPLRDEPRVTVEDVEEKSRRDAEAQAAEAKAAEEQVAGAMRALDEGKRRRAEQDATALAEQAAAGREMRRAKAVGTIVGLFAELERWPQWRAMAAAATAPCGQLATKTAALPPLLLRLLLPLSPRSSVMLSLVLTTPRTLQGIE